MIRLRDLLRHPARARRRALRQDVDYYKDNANVTVIVDRREGGPAQGSAERPRTVRDRRRARSRTFPTRRGLTRPTNRPSVATRPAGPGYVLDRRRNSTAVKRVSLLATSAGRGPSGRWSEAPDGAPARAVLRTARLDRPSDDRPMSATRRDRSELHRQRVGGRRERRDVRERRARHRRAARELPALGRRRTSTAPSPRRRRRTSGWRLVPAPRARGGALPLREPAHRAQGRADRADVARDGQGARRGRRRRPGGDRHEPLHGRRGPASLRPDDAVGAARTSS